MSELLLLRHAHAGDPDAWRGDDAERPLSEKGVRQAERLGSLLAGIGFRADRFVSSPKVRARQTAEIVAASLGLDVEIQDRLASGASLALFELLLTELDVERPVFVGHDPDFSRAVAQLIGSDAVPMKKGALARLAVDRPLRRGGGSLRWLIPPDLLAGR